MRKKKNEVIVEEKEEEEEEEEGVVGGGIQVKEKLPMLDCGFIPPRLRAKEATLFSTSILLEFSKLTNTRIQLQMNNYEFHLKGYENVKFAKSWIFGKTRIVKNFIK
ncbi:hypothetical protein APICC_05866 [Apis cerana cerana]|uniref:Uncharacterized protein n=1 Tax=Apis cerana cerana TaxID=94128 RepID=A0A2A3EUD7_APICC|nr:hypothetical protein APICC_05866 [Apis cerana cerana]